MGKEDSEGVMRHLVQSWGGERTGQDRGGVGLQQQPSAAHLSQHGSATPTERSRNEVIIELDTAYAGTQNRQKKKKKQTFNFFLQ